MALADPMIKRFVALKTIHLGFTEPPDGDIAQRFHREAQAAGNLNHQNIVGIYEYGEDAGRAYIAMQYVEGQTLVDPCNLSGMGDFRLPGRLCAHGACGFFSGQCIRPSRHDWKCLRVGHGLLERQLRESAAGWGCMGSG